MTDLSRFLEAQEKTYPVALEEIKAGQKQSHWMWYIFPQLIGLGHSDVSKYYALQSVEDAKHFLNHPVLGKRLLEITNEVLKLECTNATEILGSPDDMKLKSCMTLFCQIENTHTVFQNVLDKFFGGKSDYKTLEIIEQAE